jgi:hypothetical protein
MSNIYYNVAFPEILETTYTIDSETRQRMINTVLSQKDDISKYHGGYTFHVTDNNGDFKNLYAYLLSTVNTVFGTLSLADRNKSWCWANVYNRDNFKTNLHNHIKTSSINAIYYLKLPHDISGEEGGLIIAKNKMQEPILFMPDEDDLLIMPNYVYHEPQIHSSLDYRIAINMEICISGNVTTYYTRDKIYKSTGIKL